MLATRIGRLRLLVSLLIISAWICGEVLLAQFGPVLWTVSEASFVRITDKKATVIKSGAATTKAYTEYLAEYRYELNSNKYLADLWTVNLSPVKKVWILNSNPTVTVFVPPANVAPLLPIFARGTLVFVVVWTCWFAPCRRQKA